MFVLINPIRKLKNKLLFLALLSSPIIAIYGVAPVYIFQKFSLFLAVGAVVFLTLTILIFWAINIYLVGRLKTDWKRYLWSYLLISIVHLSVVITAPDFNEVKGKVVFFLAYPIISILAINTIILIIINSVSLRHEKEIAEIEIKSLKVSNLEAQKQVLLQQLQPHFLFNALSTLKSLISENPIESENYVVKLSEFLRYSVQAHTKEIVLLSEELQFTQDYIDLQKMRFGEALGCEIDLPDDLLSNKIPVFALQTLVENAIKHNSFTSKKSLFIKISWEGNRLKVSNNKSAKQLIAPSGTGLVNLQKRYQMVANKEIEIINQENEFTVFIPLIERL